MNSVALMVLAVVLAAVASTVSMGGVSAANGRQPPAPPPAHVTAENGANPGEVVLRWTAVSGATSYRVGWLAVEDHQAYPDKWREKFAYSDVTASSTYTVARLTPGIDYHLIVGRKDGDGIAWSGWATLALNGVPARCPGIGDTGPPPPAARDDDVNARQQRPNAGSSRAQSRAHGSNQTETNSSANTGAGTVRLSSGTPPANVTAANGPNPGEVVLNWTAVPGATSYRIGWLAVEDHQAYPDRWREKFAYSDVTATHTYTVARLTPGIDYHLIVGRKDGDDIAWSDWATLTLNEDDALCPAVGQQGPPAPVPQNGDYDADDDGLIEVANLAQLDAVRYDLDGDGNADAAAYSAAFPDAISGMGCPAEGCAGYELVSDLDFDTNGNGRADAGDAYWNDGAGWLPIGNSNDSFTATLDGGEHTIANLYINRNDRDVRIVGLFGALTGRLQHFNPKQVGTIRAVGLESVDVTSTQGTAGGLVGYASDAAITASYATGKVAGSESAGGLIGHDAGSDIAASYAAGAVSGGGGVGGLVGTKVGGTIADSHSSAAVTTGQHADAGGLVGILQYRVGCFEDGSCFVSNVGTITGSYASGRVIACSYPDSSGCVSGGLIGGTLGVTSITGSYATGDVEACSGHASDDCASGGLVGNAVGATAITGSYATGDVEACSGNASDDCVSGGLVGRLYGGSIIASYATGSVYGCEERLLWGCKSGGLVGGNIGATIASSYAIGQVTGNQKGGLVGEFEETAYIESPDLEEEETTGAVSQDSYWDTETTGVAYSYGGGTGKTTAQLQEPTGYTGIYATWNVDVDNADGDDDAATGADDPWDFGASDQYPKLRIGAAVVDARLLASVPQLYWVDEETNKVQRTSSDNYRIVEDLVTSGLDDPGSIALDLGAGKMYWTDDGTGKIQRANLDGTGVQDLAVPASARQDPVGIALNPAAGKAYWIDRTPGKIYRADLDGSDTEELVSGLNQPYQVALDLAASRMYWTERGAHRIWRADLDGSNRQSLTPSGLADPMGIALDVSAGKMYWTERHAPNDLIRRSDPDGSNAQDLVTSDEFSLSGLALDVSAGKMYWTDEVSQKIRRANLNGTQVEDVITSGLSAPEGIAVAVAAPASTARLSDRDVLLALYNATDGPNWRNKTGWNSQTLIGEWFGVDTDEQGQVIDLDLSYNGLSGTLPAELGELDYLQSLNLRNNDVTGSIPEELGSVPSLIRLQLGGNRLTGEIPATLGGLLNLTHLNLSGNRLGFPPGSGHPTGHTFSGEIPAALARLNNLRVLDLSENYLTGRVPAAFGGFGSLANLTHLNLSGNQLSGNIPSQLRNRTTLLHLDLSNNRLSGEIPPELGNLRRLEALDLSNNDLSGVIALELSVQLDSLHRLNLSHNRLRGRLSPRLGELEHLSVLDVSNNQMTGEIPGELANLPLTVLYLHHNNFTGCLPFSQARAESIGLTPGERGVPVTCETEAAIAAELAAAAELERLVLEHLYDHMGGADWRDKPTWRTTAPINQWEEVFTNENGRVMGLDLSNSNLTGYIPQELTFLPELTWLRLSGNPIQGCIPRGLKDPLLVGSALFAENEEVSAAASADVPGIGFLPSIIENAASAVASTTLELAGLDKAAKVFSTGVTALQIADAALQYNAGGLHRPLCAPDLPEPDVPIAEQNFDSDSQAVKAILSYYLNQGNDASQFSGWTGNDIRGWNGVGVGIVGGQERVVRLGLDGRDLEGEIPAIMGNLGGLHYLNLGGNRLTGSIPPELGHLRNLRTLALNDNRLTSAAKQEARKRVREDANGEVEIVDATETYREPIPPELANLLRLEKLYLQNNRLTGMMPQDLDLLTYTSLRAMDVDREGDYQLSGCLRPNSKFVLSETIPQITDAAIDLVLGALKLGVKTAANVTIKAVKTLGPTVSQHAAEIIGPNIANFAANAVAKQMTSNHDLGVVGEVVSAIFGPSERVGELIGRMGEFFGFYGLGGEFDMGNVYCKGS